MAARQVKSVIVLGGGSAGFMAALALRARMPDLPVTVVRSKEIAIIGVGEGSTVALTLFLHDYLKVPMAAFHEVARPTWKLGLKFIWGPRPHFFYSFSPEQMHHRHPDLPRNVGFYCQNDVADADPIAALMARDRAFERGPNGVPRFHDHVAYHFENERFVGFLERHAAAMGVSILDDTVVDVRRDENGIASLALRSGGVAAADLYVDASGFASALLGRALGEPFEPFASSLFCDRAVVGGWDRAASDDPVDQVIKPYTTCETMPAGWAWQIDHEHRINRGYVYASAFETDSGAEAEFRRQNPRVGPTRVVRFTSGRYRRGWVQNVVAIGNASGFVEPLEATALGVIAVQSRLLADSLVDAGRHLRPTHARAYNEHHARYWDGIRGFIAAHYKFNTRLDTPFWQACRADTNLAAAEPVIDYFLENGPSQYWAPALLPGYDAFGLGGYATLLVGMKVPYAATHDSSPQERQVCDSRRRRYGQAAETALTVREALDIIRSPRWRWA